MNDILIQVNILRKDNDENLYHFILEQLNSESNDIELWLGLAASKSNKIKLSGQVNNASNLKNSVDNKIAKTVFTIDQNSAAILKNDYYEVNGFKFTQFYYNKLWDNGRKCPGFRAESILSGATSIVPDPQGYEGFFKYVYNDWEMIFNPSTKIVAHLSPIAPSKRKLI